jgi:hypothetical protein
MSRRKAAFNTQEMFRELSRVMQHQLEEWQRSGWPDEDTYDYLYADWKKAWLVATDDERDLAFRLRSLFLMYIDRNYKKGIRLGEYRRKLRSYLECVELEHGDEIAHLVFEDLTALSNEILEQQRKN